MDIRKKRHEYALQFENGLVVNGCAKADCYSAEVLGRLQGSSVEFGTVWESGEMPVFQFGDAFKKYRTEQIKLQDHLRENRISCTLPWEVLKILPPDRKVSDRLYWSQGSVGSCMGHADAFAHHSATLTAIACGMPLVYSPFNPLVTWCITKGGSMWGGQSVSEMAEGANKLGHYTEANVGPNNQRMPDYKAFTEDAKKYQSAMVFLEFRGEELCEEIFECCHAGLAVAFGNSTAVSGATTDANGIKVAKIGGSWAHATHFAGWRKVNGTKYIGWINSHGSRYGQSDEGEPGDMCWMDQSTASRFCSTMSQYGSPYVVLPESTWVKNHQTTVDLIVPFPEKWRF